MAALNDGSTLKGQEEEMANQPQKLVPLLGSLLLLACAVGSDVALSQNTAV
jgi:hypothetical protein